MDVIPNDDVSRYLSFREKLGEVEKRFHGVFQRPASHCDCWGYTMPYQHQTFCFWAIIVSTVGGWDPPCARAEFPPIPAEYRLVYVDGFHYPAAQDGFFFSDPAAWRVGVADGRHYLEQFQKSDYQYKVRSPHNVGLISSLRFRNFVLECSMQQTGKEYGHRDMCLFFGFQNRAQFYYTHIATKADDHAHSCFFVNNQPRVSIARDRTDGFDWGLNQWQRIRLVRNAESGAILVYANQNAEPIIEANDTTFEWGYVGFGSFDDTGRVGDIMIWADATKAGEFGRQPFQED